MNTNEGIIRKLNTIINEKGVTLEYLSKATGINILKLYLLLHGKFFKLKLTSALLICKELDIKISNLFV